MCKTCGNLTHNNDTCIVCKNREKTVIVKFEPADYARVQLIAESANSSMAEFIEDCVLMKINERSIEDDES